MNTLTQHHDYMTLALKLAELGRLTVSPNPMVGCIIVKNNKIIGQGWHKVAGQPHAEIYALNEAGSEANGATAYVTLEPCCHFGKTPPCTNALIAANIKTVVIACSDPNPLVAGNGIAALKAAGVEVIMGYGEQQAIALNKIFFHYIKHGRPYIISKWAMSLDGKTITHAEDDRFISSPESVQHSHQLRQMVDAIIIGSRTAIYDDPQLTVRNFSVTNSADNVQKTATLDCYATLAMTKQPLRVILASAGNLPLTLQCLNNSPLVKTIVATTKKAHADWLSAAQAQSVDIWVCADKNGQVDLHDLLDRLGKAGISSALVEGGETLHTAFFQENLVNQLQIYLAPKIIAKLIHKKTLTHFDFAQLGPDLSISATFGE